MSVADVKPFYFQVSHWQWRNGQYPCWDLVIPGLSIFLFGQHEYQSLKPAMTKYINIISRKRRGLRLDSEDGLGQLAWKERSN